MEYKCGWDLFSLLFTISAIIILLAFIIYLFFKIYQSYLQKNRCIMLLSNVFLLLLLMTLFIPLLYSPVKIIISSKNVHIKQVKGDIIIPFQEITELRKTTNYDEKNSTRKFGSGGLWGNLGFFSSPKLGNYKKFATNENNRVVIKTKTETYVVSCNMTDSFILNVNNKILSDND